MAQGSPLKMATWRPWLTGAYLAHALLGWLAALHLAWMALAAMNFLYPLWHDLLGIEQTIARYGPENRYREDFQLTDGAERARLFAALVDAIHQRGEGLADLRYHHPDGRELGVLLREPEIVHLQDVARLVAMGGVLGWLALAGWLSISAWWLRRGLLPPPWAQLRRLAVMVGGVCLVVLLLGPTRVFYQLHIWLFPPGHPWFFYYQDSLMTTMMQAPNLFGAIALFLLVLSLGIFFLGTWLGWRRQRAQSGRLSMGRGSMGSAGRKPKIRP